MPDQIRTNDFITFARPSVSQSELDNVSKIIQSGWWGTGKFVAEFSNKFANYKHAENVLMTNSCTSALILALKLCNLKEGDEVITTAMTFAATVNSILHAGGSAVLCDVYENTNNINIELLENLITNRTKAIVVVHYAGYPLNLKKIREICDRYNLRLIEDCAHAIETVSANDPAGTVGDFGCFSFYSTKNLSTGEGGALICRDKNEFDRATVMSLHGMSRDAWSRFSETGYKHYDVIDCGYKFNMMDIQAGLGLAQLKRLPEFEKIRRRTVSVYESELNTNIFQSLEVEVEKNSNHALHLYPVRLETEALREHFLSYMNANKIGVGIHYRAISDLSFYQKNEKVHMPVKLDNAEIFGRTSVSLPLGNDLNEHQIEKIISVIKRFKG